MQSQKKSGTKILVVDDDSGLCSAISEVLSAIGYDVETHNTPATALEEDLSKFDCLVLDVRMPHMSGLHFQEKITALGVSVPIVFMTGYADVPMAVQAMKLGAVEFLQKPFREIELIDAVNRATISTETKREVDEQIASALLNYNTLTSTEKQIMSYICDGLQTKQIAFELGRSSNTVKIHRQRVMQKMNCRSVASLVAIRNMIKDKL